MAYAQDKGKGEKKKPSAVVRYWTNEIAAARKRDKEYRKEGNRIREIYDGRRKDRTPFNILYSNTETLLPALYGQTPKPIVQRRFKDADPVGRAAAMAGQRMLEFLIDTNIEDYETFDVAMRDTVLDALLPGRGIPRVKYDAEVTPVPTGEVNEDQSPVTFEQKTFETVCAENVAWDRVYFGYAKKWQKVPWVAFEHYMDKAEAKKMFGERVAAQMQFTESNETERSEDGERSESPKGSTFQGERKTCLVYEIWVKKDKKVCFFSDSYIDGYLKEEEDPLELTGFFPIPRPLQFLTKTNDLTPSALYLLYENQATELNRISVRINRIVEAIKVRGAYDGSLGDTLNDLLKADDNTMIGTDNASNIALAGGLDKYIWFMPLDMLIKVLQQLVVARQECKQIIYEVTGLSDIIRGASKATETATAQEIKNQWGSLRIKMTQNEVRRLVRETLRMMLELAAKRFSPDTFAKMTGLPFTTQAMKQQAQAIVMAAQQSGQSPDPQALKTLATPDWESVVGLLRDDISRAYRIDIETNSTVQVDELEDKQLITEALGAIGAYLKGVTPLVQEGVMPFEAAKSMLLAIVRRFRFGTEVEEEIKSMQAPQKGPDPETQKQLQDAQKMVAEATKAKEVAEKQSAEADIRMKVNEAEKKLIAREASLDVREIKLTAAEAQHGLEQGAAEKAGKLTEQADNVILKGVPGMQQAVAQMAQANEEFKAQVSQAMEAHAAEMKEMMAMAIQAAQAKRKRTPKRGPDGRIAEVIDEVIA